MNINMEEKRDLYLSGAGICSGGEFNNVSISGSGKINGDIKCVKYTVSGSSKIDGDINSEEIKISGRSKISGQVICEDLKVSGKCIIENSALIKNLSVSGEMNIDNKAKVEEVKVSGMLSVNGDFNGNTLNVAGSLKVASDCEFERFNSSGAFDIDGLLNGEEIDIKIYERCFVKEIGCRTINVSRRNQQRGILNFLFSSISSGYGKLEFNSLEGEEIYLEYTTANVVRGNNIKIGPGCHIEKIEYKNELIVDEDSKVKFREQI